jgi:predicted Zn-dependent protease with MMP-like domain
VTIDTATGSPDQYGMTRDEFEGLVADALDGIPDEFAAYLSNVAVVVEDEPAPGLLRSLGLDPQRSSLYGLYQGVPLARRPHDFTGLPDRITIFAGPLRRDFPTRALRHQIQVTVVHEIAHFFGLDEHRVRQLGY